MDKKPNKDDGKFYVSAWPKGRYTVDPEFQLKENFHDLEYAEYRFEELVKCDRYWLIEVLERNENSKCIGVKKHLC